MSEDRLSKGVFWQKGEKLLAFPLRCDEEGNLLGGGEYPLESKDGTNYNHQKLWARLPHSVTDGNPFNYYPRGRVEIAGGEAAVFLHPALCNEETEREIVRLFGLTAENKIRRVRFIADGSSHYHAEGI